MLSSRPIRLAFLCAIALPSCVALAPESEGASERRELAARLFAEHCAACHGAAGEADGRVAASLFPPPRRFSDGRLRLTSARDGRPVRADIEATLRRGMPGSAMPSWEWLGDEAVGALAGHVLELVEVGAERRITLESLTAGEALDRAAARERAKELVQAEARFEAPPRVTPNASVLARGKALYRENCARCHGETGRGLGLEPRWNEDGSLNWPRDFTAGALKGGASFEALATRIACGMPGSAMPSFELPQADLAALATYTASLIPQASEERLVQRSGELVARLIDGHLPTNGLDERWKDAPELEVTLAPIAWRDDAVFSVHVAALHDGHELALRLRWNDPTRDDRLSVEREEPRLDAAAVALSNEMAPPLAGMGAEEHPVNLWHWRASSAVDLLGVLDLVEAAPHLLRDPLANSARADVAPLYLPAPGGALSGGRSAELEGRGAGATEPHEGDLRTLACHTGSEWNVVFVRALASNDERAVELGREPLVAAFAIWDAARGDHGAVKSFSIWQRVVVR